MCYEQIALHLDRSVKSVDNAMQRVKKKIERNLATFEFR
jgi:DNA-directed RNA polymerase specialized sigma24 family protein